MSSNHLLSSKRKLACVTCASNNQAPVFLFFETDPSGISLTSLHSSTFRFLVTDIAVFSVIGEAILFLIISCQGYLRFHCLQKQPSSPSLHSLSPTSWLCGFFRAPEFPLIGTSPLTGGKMPITTPSYGFMQGAQMVLKITDKRGMCMYQ